MSLSLCLWHPLFYKVDRILNNVFNNDSPKLYSVSIKVYQWTLFVTLYDVCLIYIFSSSRYGIVHERDGSSNIRGGDVWRGAELAISRLQVRDGGEEGVMAAC